MADKFGNYTAAFLIAGGVGVIASIIPFLLICVRRESEQSIDHNLINRGRDQRQSEEVDRKDEKQKDKSERCPNSEITI